MPDSLCEQVSVELTCRSARHATVARALLPGVDPKRLDPVGGRIRPGSNSLVERRQAATPMHGEPEQIGIRELARGDHSGHRSVEDADVVGPERVSRVRCEVSQDLASDPDLECVTDGRIGRDPHEAELRQRTSRKPSYPAEPPPSHTMVLVARPEQGDQEVDVEEPRHRNRSISSALTPALVRRGAPFGVSTTGRPFLRRTTLAPRRRREILSRTMRPGPIRSITKSSPARSSSCARIARG
jgi:hypothetical protein